MKSKSFDLKRSPADKGKNNKTFDFISLYKSAAENSNVVVNVSGEGTDKENSSQNETPRKISALNKKKKGKQEPLDISRINIEGPTPGTLSKNSPLNQSKLTSTPRSSNKDKSPMKSIMKSAVNNDETMDGSQVYYSSNPKKRNKSVSFRLDDNEDVVPKKTKSEESLAASKKKSKEQQKPEKPNYIKEKKVKKIKKQIDNNVGDTSMDTEPVSIENEVDSVVNGDSEASVSNEKSEKKKKVKLFTNHKNAEPASSESNITVETDNKNKKVNKKKRKEKPAKATDVEMDEPAAKTRKREVKPEVIAENLENLTIGDNPHTLTSLLDEMTVADKDKKKKSKHKQRKDNVQTSTETDNSEGTKEKVKWTKNWNKSKKHNVDIVASSVIVEDLPLSLICSYKKVLAEHFEKCGVIKKIGIAETYPDESNTGFTTTIHFESDTAATEALLEDGATINGHEVHVKRPLPPTETTLVVRSYAPLSDQAVCSTYSTHGKIRSIRRLIKGKKSIETVFIEFDGPEAVEKAIEISKGAKVAGKKIHVAKFEIRKKKAKKPAPTPKDTANSDGEVDSEDSND